MPVARSQRTIVSRWFVMPTPTTRAASTPASTSRAQRFDRLDDLGRIVLDEPGRGMVLRVTMLSHGKPPSVARHKGRATRGRSLIEREDQFVGHVGHSLSWKNRPMCSTFAPLDGSISSASTSTTPVVSSSRSRSSRGSTSSEARPTTAIVRLTSASFSGEAVVDLRDDEAHHEGWARYVAAVVAELHAHGIEVRGFEGELASDLPAGSGLSSSAALEVCVAGALAHEAGVDLGRDGARSARTTRREPHRCPLRDHGSGRFGSRSPRQRRASRLRDARPSPRADAGGDRDRGDRFGRAPAARGHGLRRASARGRARARRGFRRPSCRRSGGGIASGAACRPGRAGASPTTTRGHRDRAGPGGRAGARARGGPRSR